MYPFIRMGYQFYKNRKAPPLPVDGVHVSHHMCWPVDLDMWRELNNGRTLTLYDLGRIFLARRIGLIDALKRRGWGMTMAGVTARYRRRVVMFDRFEMRSKALGHDGRFIYLQQSMWKDGEALSSVVYRVAVFTKDGIVDTHEVAAEMGLADWNPEMPQWVQDWRDSERARTWPPET